jgi:glutamyl-tRNA synthetase
MSLEKSIEKYALLNASKYNGKANPGAVIGSVIKEDPKVKENMKELGRKVNEIIKKINSMSLDEQKKALDKFDIKEKKKEKKGLPELKIKGKPVFRIAPYPSGPLHIGNAKQLVINDEYAKKYLGNLILVYDDTIGSEEKNITKEAYKLIMEGTKYLGCKISKYVYKSDRLLIYYEYVLKLIKKGKAYVCLCSSEKLRENRKKGIECSCRNNSVEKNIKEWQKMLNEYKEGEAILRIKTDMKHKNPAFRDRVLFRISERKHPRIKKQFRVWPLLEFSWAIDDHLLGITHIIRGKDLMMETEMEKYIWDIFGWPYPEVIHTGLVQIEGVKISKSKSKKEVLDGIYTGWDDPRTWSLQSLERRGIKAEAVRRFCLDSGLNANEVTLPIENLYSENRKLIEMDANRYFFIENPKKVKIEGAPKQKVSLLLHPDYPNRGERVFDVEDEFYISENDYNRLKDGKLYRLMDCLNFVKKGSKLKFDSLEYEKYKEKGDRIMHFLPVSDDLLEVEIITVDGSIKKGLSEAGIKKLKKENIIQFERFGYCRYDGNNVFWYTHK